MSIKYPEITVKLTEEDGNVFTLIAVVHAALKRANVVDAREFMREAMESGSYDEALQCMMRWVTVE